MAQMSENSSQSPTDPDVIRKFLETDDGKEFVMLNLVRLHQGDVAHPDTGELTTAPSILQGYFGPFSKALFRKAGHPAFVGRKKGGYIDSWNSAADEGFQIVYEQLSAAENMGASLTASARLIGPEHFIPF